MDSASYNHLYGVMRSRETELLGAAQLRALANMPDVSEVGQVLVDAADSPFLRQFSASYDEASLEAGISAELEHLRQLIDTYAPEQRLRDLLLVPLDLYNVKVALRLWARRLSDSAAADAARGDSVSDQSLAAVADLYGLPGTRSVEQIHDAVLSEGGGGVAIAGAGDLDSASRALAATIEKALQAHAASGHSGQALELAIDRLARLYCVEMSSPAAAGGAIGANTDAEPDGVREVLRAEADIAAAELIVRGSAGGLTWDVARWGLLEMPGIAEIEDLYTVGAQEWGGRLAPFSGELRQVFREIADGHDASVTLREAQRRIGTTMVSWLLRPPSFAFAYGYARKKLDDLANLRLACLARLRGVAADQVEQRIRFGMAAA